MTAKERNNWAGNVFYTWNFKNSKSNKVGIEIDRSKILLLYYCLY